MITTEANPDSGWKINPIIVTTISIILFVAIWQIRNIVLLTFASVILVILFSMPIRFCTSRYHIPRGVAILGSIVGFFIVLIILSLLVFPTLFNQFGILATDVIPRGFERLVDFVNSGAIQEQFPFLREPMENFTINDELINQIIAQVSNALGQLGGSVLPLVGGLANTLLSGLIVFFLSMYLIAEPQRYIKGIITLTPKWYRGRMRHILFRIDDTLRAWLVVTGVSMLVVGLGTGLGLAAIGIREWVALGVLAGIMSFVPNFGPIIALVPSIAVGFVQAPENVIWIVVIIYGVSFIQSQLISPVLASERMNMPAILILLGQIVFGFFFGFLGIMLAVPITALGVILVDEIYVKDVLGDRNKDKAHREILEDDDDLLPETD